jgi:hypothetical protein
MGYNNYLIFFAIRVPPVVSLYPSPALLFRALLFRSVKMSPEFTHFPPRFAYISPGFTHIGFSTRVRY